MKCPICGNEMKAVRTGVSNNEEKGKDFKEYNRTLYNCDKDDVWANVEIPK